MKAKSKFIGSVMMAAIGDALGWITEFENKVDQINKKYGDEQVDRFYDWQKTVGGRFNGYIDYIQSGAYSDDTQLLLAVARSIKTNGKVDNNYFAKNELANWLSYSRGAGRTVKNAARKITRKSVQWNSNFYSFKIGKSEVDYRDCGANGAAMRVLPIALANFDDFNNINVEIFKNSIITHGHPRALIGAMLYGHAVNSILKYSPESFNYSSFLTELGKDIDQKFKVDFERDLDLKSWLLAWDEKSTVKFLDLFQEILYETQEYLRIIYRALRDSEEDIKCLDKIGCFDKSTKGSGTSTVIAGIYLASKYYDTPQKSVTSAVNCLGIDTDSVAAFSGGLIGALHGKSVIPKKWMSVQDVDYLEKTAGYLYKITMNETPAQPIQSTMELSQLDVLDKDTFKEGDKVNVSPLGKGEIVAVDRQDALTRGKYNLILDVDFEIGQSCRYSKLLNHQ